MVKVFDVVSVLVGVVLVIILIGVIAIDTKAGHSSETSFRSTQNAGDIDIRIVKVQSHDYIVLDGYKQGGICHSESCPCKSK